MIKRIWKYTIPGIEIRDVVEIAMPLRARALSVTRDWTDPLLAGIAIYAEHEEWAVDPADLSKGTRSPLMEMRRFYILGTGNAYPTAERIGSFIGTAATGSGLVWHVFNDADSDKRRAG